MIRETPSAATLVLGVDGWPGHRAGQHLDVRLTAEDGYTAQRSYSIATPPEDPVPAITVERLDDGEVSPYLVDEARAGRDAEARLLLSAKTPEDVLDAAELQAFDVTYTYTRQAPPGWTGYARRVDREMLAEAGFPPERKPWVYVCGPTSFVEAAAEALVALGHDSHRIRTERFGATGR